MTDPDGWGEWCEECQCVHFGYREEE